MKRDPEIISDIATSPKEYAKYLWEELAAAMERDRSWRHNARLAWQAYRLDDVTVGSDGTKSKQYRQYNLFFSNVEVLKPLVFSRAPTPVVRRQSRPESGKLSEIGAEAAKAMEQILKVLLDQQQRVFTSEMMRVRDDYIIGGRGLARVVYVPPEFTPAPSPIPVEKLDDGSWQTPDRKVVPAAEVKHRTAEDGTEVHEFQPPGGGTLISPERVEIRYADSQSILLGPGRRWEEIGWIAARSYAQKTDIIRSFGQETADRASYHVRRITGMMEDNSILGGGNYDDGGNQEQESPLGYAELWQFFDRYNRRVVWACRNSQSRRDRDRNEDSDSELTILAIFDDDANKLPGFFPFAEPVQTCSANYETTPVPEYMQYRGQLMEIDRITTAVENLTRGIKVAGVCFGADEAIVRQLLEGDETKPVIVPVPDRPDGAVKASDLVDWMPADDISRALQILMQSREAVVAEVYQIVGISDIHRGFSDARETAHAQELKVQSSQSRVDDRKNAFARMLRDCIENMAHIVCARFSDESIISMGQINLPSKQEIEAAAMQMVEQVKAQIGNAMMFEVKPPSEEDRTAAIAEVEQKAQQMLEQTITRDDVLGMLRDVGVRSLLVDVETDSTVAFEERSFVEGTAKTFEAVTRVFEALTIPLQTGSLPPEFPREVLKLLLRQMRMGRSLEGVLEQAPPVEQQPQEPPIDQTKVQVKQMEIDAESKEKALDRDHALQMEQARTEREDIRKRSEVELKRRDQEIALLRANAEEASRERDQILKGQGQILDALAKLAKVQVDEKKVAAAAAKPPGKAAK